MKSCSHLFPVRLMAAETRADLTEDVYLIKANNSPDRSVEIALTHVTSRAVAPQPELPPLVFLHSNHQNRHIWLTPDGKGLAAELARRGADIWLVESRGHGASPVNRDYASNTWGDCARYDLPPVVAFVREQGGRPPLLLGYQQGGQALLASAALVPSLAEGIAGIVCLGSPFSIAGTARLPGLANLKGWLSKSLVKKAALGPEFEPLSVYRAIWKEQSKFSWLGKTLGIDVWRSLASLSLPLMSVSMLGWREQLDQSQQANLDAVAWQDISLSGCDSRMAPDCIYQTLQNDDFIHQCVESLESWWQGLAHPLGHSDESYSPVRQGMSDEVSSASKAASAI